MTASSLGRMERFHSDHCDCAHSECLNKQSHKMTCFFVYGVAIHKEKLAFRIRRHLLQHLLQAGRGPTRTIPSESQIPALGSRIGSCWDRDTPARFAYCVCLQAEEEGKTKNTAAVLSLSVCLSVRRLLLPHALLTLVRTSLNKGKLEHGTVANPQAQLYKIQLVMLAVPLHCMS